LIGVAADPIETLQRFSTEACRSKFPVAVASTKMIADYDVKLPLMGRSNRTSFVIGKDGKIAYVLSEMKPDGHITGTLGALQALREGKKAL
jgi:peroxiredoxin